MAFAPYHADPEWLHAAPLSIDGAEVSIVAVHGSKCRCS
jgi:hypothetical protein